MSEHDEMLRADAAERELRRANHVLARILEMTDAWEHTFGSKLVRADVLTKMVRRTVRETP